MTKADLILATVSVLWKEIVYEMIASIDHEQYEKQNGLGQVECLLNCFKELFEQHSEYVMFSYDYKLFLIRQEAYLTESEYIDEIKPIQNMYVKALKKGMKDGSVSAYEDIDTLYYAIWGLMRGYIVKIVIYDRMYRGHNMWRNSFESACEMIISGLKHGTVPGV